MNSARTVNQDDAAAQLGISRTLFRRLARENKLPYPLVVIQLGNRRLISQAAIDALLSPTTIPEDGEE